MTNGEKIKAILKPRTNQIRIFGEWIEIEIQSLSINFSCELSWWNAENQEPTTECGQSINKSAMMQEIYMEGVNMGGEYQGCWVRFKEIEKIVDKYVR